MANGKLGMDPARADILVNEFQQAETGVRDLIVKLRGKIGTITADNWWEGTDAGQFQNEYISETNKIITEAERIIQAGITELKKQKQQQMDASGSGSAAP